MPHYQCEHHMSDRKRLSYLLEEIRKVAPEYVISISGSGTGYEKEETDR